MNLPEIEPERSHTKKTVLFISCEGKTEYEYIQTLGELTKTFCTWNIKNQQDAWPDPKNNDFDLDFNNTLRSDMVDLADTYYRQSVKGEYTIFGYITALLEPLWKYGAALIRDEIQNSKKSEANETKCRWLKQELNHYDNQT